MVTHTHPDLRPAPMTIGVVIDAGLREVIGFIEQQTDQPDNLNDCDHPQHDLTSEGAGKLYPDGEWGGRFPPITPIPCISLNQTTIFGWDVDGMIIRAKDSNHVIYLPHDLIAAIKISRMTKLPRMMKQIPFNMSIPLR